MVASIQSIDKFAQQRKQSAAGDAEFSTGGQHGRLQMIVQLQSTLDIEQLLQLFFDHAVNWVKVDGIAYLEDQRDIHFKVGKQSNHSCGYRLLSGDDNFGEITFKRSKRFKEDELHQLEELLVLLLIPVKNALRYIDAVDCALHAPALSPCDKPTLQRLLSREIELAKRHNRPLSLLTLIFECSHQKRTTKLPTTITQEIVRIVRANCRDTDLLVRSGGKEFQLLLPMENSGATTIGARIRRDLKKRLGKHSGHGLTVDIGHASLTGTDSLKSLVGRAKNRLRT